MMAKLRDRPTGDLLVLMIAGTICGVVVITMVTVLIVDIVHPNSDTSNAAKGVGDIVGALIGLLAGFLAGRQMPKNGDEPKE
jgi:hypothetical protein